MSLEWLGSNISSFVTFPSSICRAQLAVEVSLESVGLRCWGVSFWFMIFMVAWVAGEIRIPFLMNSWILFCCTCFFRFFLVISDGFEPLWSGSPPRHVSITSEDEQMLLPRQRFNRLMGSVNRHCVFWQSLNSTYLSLLRFFVVFFFETPYLVLEWNIKLLLLLLLLLLLSM